MFGIAKKLKAMGIVGINKRNCELVLPNNPRRLYPLVDDKLRTKNLAGAVGIQVPELYATVETEHDISRVEKMLQNRDEFVIKPVNGSGGKGIIVVVGRHKKNWIKASGDRITIMEIRRHLSNILSGIYSLGGTPDTALIEYRVHSHSIFDRIAYKGVPDVRVILYKGIPVMAMLRLPTRASDGKANLHQGAVGVGVNLITGHSCGAVCKNEMIEHHPDSDEPLLDFQVPFWKDLRLLASRCYELVPLGYLGVDIVIDQAFGPMVLELNARPGLSIQICNQRGLQHAVDWVDRYKEEHNNQIPQDAHIRSELAERLYRDLVPSAETTENDEDEQSEIADHKP